MNKLRSIIVDDEQHSIDSLLWELEAVGDKVEIIATCTNPHDAKRQIQLMRPDLVFLDIEMPGMNGFDLLHAFDTIDFDIVFTTAYDEFALKAFEIDATDYLLKPVSEEALQRSLDKVSARRAAHQTTAHLSALFHKLKRDYPDFRKVALPTLEGLLFLNIEDITHCSSEDNYTHIYSQKGEKFLISKTLKEIETMISDSRFLRVHHSHLVNLMCIREYHKGKGGSLVLDDGTVIPVSRSRKQDLMDKF
jgi:two-component system LytT family response regulator